MTALKRLMLAAVAMGLIGISPASAAFDSYIYFHGKPVKGGKPLHGRNPNHSISATTDDSDLTGKHHKGGKGQHHGGGKGNPKHSNNGDPYSGHPK